MKKGILILSMIVGMFAFNHSHAQAQSLKSQSQTETKVKRAAPQEAQQKEVREDYLTKVTRELELTDTQVAQVKKLIEKRDRELTDAKINADRKSSEIANERYQKEFINILTPEQQKKFEAQKEARRSARPQEAKQAN